MSWRPWWIAFVVLALVVGLVAGYSFAPFTASTLTASTPSAPVTVAYSVPVAVQTACSTPCGSSCSAPAPAACCVASEGSPCCCSKDTSCCSKGTGCCCSKSPAEAPKQYVHFLIKDIEVKTGDATFTLGKVSFMYKGDGIEADVAKTAMGADTSKALGKVVDVNELAELITKLMTTKASADKSADDKDADKDAPEPTPVTATLPSCTPCAPECLPSPATCLTEELVTEPVGYAPCATAPCGGCTEAANVSEGCETEDRSPEQVEEAEPEMLPAPTETPVEDKIDD